MRAARSVRLPRRPTLTLSSMAIGPLLAMEKKGEKMEAAKNVLPNAESARTPPERLCSAGPLQGICWWCWDHHKIPFNTGLTLIRGDHGVSVIGWTQAGRASARQ